MGKNLFSKFICLTVISAWVLAFSGGVFAAEPAKPAKPAGAESQPSDGKKKPNINQIAFIVKFDKNGDGKVDRTEFTGSHFPVFDKNGDGFIEPHEAPEGQTAY